MNKIDKLYKQIVQDLEEAGKNSPYAADANELDPRYKSYGVRAEGKRVIFRLHHSAIRKLELRQQFDLARRLIESRFGEQQSFGLQILEPYALHFTPDRFDELDAIARCLHGWSKVDAFTGSLLRDVWFQYPDPLKSWVEAWNQDLDMWLRRTSVVLFTRKVAKSGLFNDFALAMCNNLIDAEEDLVQKGVGWALKDLMHSDKARILRYVHQLRKQKISSTITLYAIRDLKGQERQDFLALK